ncbi:MAG: hypothetical protein EWM47_03555 [Anaerolineaceae bacterium]|nr:MAG: hypothetical protein EWM47_03555 [Anaerolineaceae bacterium]
MSIILKSKRLTVEIAEPGIEPNTTTRFDRAGFITQVTLDRKYEFCTKEPNNLSHPCSGGVGLCSEFSLQKPADDAPIGTRFPKLGIGLLTKAEDKYYFYYKYDCEPFDITYKHTDTSITFETIPKLCMGYAARQIKSISIHDNELFMSITVENLGELPLIFDEYCHNFLTIENLPIGEDYYLSMPVVSQDKKSPWIGDSLIGRGSGITYNKYSDSASIIDVERDEITADAPIYWKLTNRKSPAWVSEEVSVKPERIRIWSIDHIISPEVICSFTVAPGEKTSWTRKWTFGCK